ncbi:hypothetical protein [Paracoccus sp. PAR01]|uniref:hypothetical protein n=1 Tax=Paracoccus sp. PAR01 TaxID=2769282 RepID=UPI00177DC21E|nr:hypothetical protein [Paracoccus sp. PAR01]MBD9528240.1 hypothetical protein [Paracoccus sp. PAR01]
MAAIGVHLVDANFMKTRTGDLLKPIAPGEMTSGERASAAADFINGFTLGLLGPRFEQGRTLVCVRP